MGSLNLVILSALALLSLSACSSNRVFPSGLTLSQLGPNMQVQMEEELARNGYLSTGQGAKYTGQSVSHSNNF